MGEKQQRRRRRPQRRRKIEGGWIVQDAFNEVFITGRIKKVESFGIKKAYIF